MMTSVKVVNTSLATTKNSPSQDYFHLYNQTTQSNDIVASCVYVLTCLREILLTGLLLSSSGSVASGTL